MKFKDVELQMVFSPLNMLKMYNDDHCDRTI